MQNLENYLTEHPFFADFQPEHLALVAGCAKNVRFEDGDYLGKALEEANQFFILRTGRVVIEIHAAQRGDIQIQTLGAGDVIGWSWLVLPYRWHFHIRATELTRAIALDGVCLRQKCSEDHELGYEFMTRIAHLMEQRLKATTMQLIDIYGKQNTPFGW